MIKKRNVLSILLVLAVILSPLGNLGFNNNVVNAVEVENTAEIKTISVETAIVVFDENGNYSIHKKPSVQVIDKDKHEGGLTVLGSLQATTDVYDFSSNGFMESIDGITPPSAKGGWMFTVNDVEPDVGASQVKLKDGDKVVWFATFDWERDNGPSWADINTKEAIESLREYTSKKENLTFREVLAYNHSSDNLENSIVEIGSKFKTNEEPTSASNYVGNILGLLAIGENPNNYNGKDYVKGLSSVQDEAGKFIIGEYDDYSTTQAFAIIALDMVQTDYNRDKAIDSLLRYQDEKGSFGGVDETGMVLAALGKYKEDTKIQAAINKALGYIKEEQDAETGGFITFDSESPYSAAAVIQGLIAVGEDPLSKEWTKEGKTIVDSLMNFYKDDHFENESEWGLEVDSVTEQAFMALADLSQGESMFNYLYGFEEPINVDFKDIEDHWAKEEISIMASEGIIKGKSEDIFDPNGKITRAEFSALISRVLMLNEDSDGILPFKDVKKDEWYYGSVLAIFESGLIDGKSETSFDPKGNITREEMTKIMGQMLINYSFEKGDLEVLSEFKDADKISDWAKEGAATSVHYKLVKGDNGNFNPKGDTTRAEAAVILYRLYELE